jgi:hypothetical protein
MAAAGQDAAEHHQAWERLACVDRSDHSGSVDCLVALVLPFVILLSRCICACQMLDSNASVYRRGVAGRWVCWARLVGLVDWVDWGGSVDSVHFAFPSLHPPDSVRLPLLIPLSNA